MTIVVIGGSGFIGSHLVEDLLNRGHDVNVLSCDGMHNLQAVKDRVKYFDIDVRDIETLKHAIGPETEGIINMAALINVDQSIDAPEQFLRTNVIGAFNVLEVARLMKVPKLVYMSSCEVYGNVPSGKADENHPTNPRSPYAASKFAAERYHLSYSYTYKEPVINVVRAFNTFGPRQSYGKGGAVIPISITSLLDGKKIRIFGDGKQTRDYVFVKDTARGVADAFEKDLPNGDVVNLATGVETSIRDIAEKLCKLAGKDFKETVEFIAARPGEVSRFCGDSSKAKKVLGWEPKTKFDEGLAVTFDWFQKNYKR
jgi:dTDP-glucose 4,6-dehydratase